MEGPAEEKPKVVSLRGRAFAVPGVVNEHVVKFLEEALAKAQAGEIDGIAAVFHHADDCTSGGFRGIIRRGLLGVLQVVEADLIDELRRSDG